METCMICEFTSNDRAAFTGDSDVIICISCHLALAEESRGEWHEVPFGVPPGWELVATFAGMQISSPKEK